MRVGGQEKAETLRTFPTSHLRQHSSTKEVPMVRLPCNMNTLKTLLYGIVATVTWLLTTIYYLLAASH